MEKVVIEIKLGDFPHPKPQSAEDSSGSEV